MQRFFVHVPLPPSGSYQGGTCWNIETINKEELQLLELCFESNKYLTFFVL